MPSPTISQDNSFSEKSEEVQAIIDRMPTKYSKYLVLLIGGLMFLILILSTIIKYPDTVDGKISITALQAPVRIIANQSGMIHLIKPNKSILVKGQVIAYIENGANYEHILQLDSLMQDYNVDMIEHISIPDNLVLGEVNASFNTFALAHTKYKHFLRSDLYRSIRNSLKNQIMSEKKIVNNIDKELLLKNKIIDITDKQLRKDSILFSMQAITEEDFQKTYSSSLTLEEALIDYRSKKLVRLSEINKKKSELDKLNLEEYESKEKLYSELILQKNTLVNAILTWKEKYVKYAPIEGELQYLGFWRENSYIHLGEELFTIIPQENNIIGEVLIPSLGAGKVKVGQLSNVKLDNYPYDEFGLIKGTVQSISRITNTTDTKEGKVETYLVTISFPEGMKTNYGMSLDLDFETKGNVEIITRRKRLLERLFDNLKSKAEK